jgi:hypothetical protein
MASHARRVAPLPAAQFGVFFHQNCAAGIQEHSPGIAAAQRAHSKNNAYY